ncbi:MAG: DUF2889 domain-containing protein [Gammaproteobacteria bacterium]
MPLSPPIAREHVHTREIECRGYRRQDGLWDIEGHLTDAKTYGFVNRDRGRVEAGEPVHEMWLRITIDESLLIHDIEAVTDASPYRMCPDITPQFQRLKGLRIGPGWNRSVHQRVGGVEGCTHLVELLRPLATTAFQTLVAARSRQHERTRTGRPRWLDTCHAHATASPVVKVRWPEFYTGE